MITTKTNSKTYNGKNYDKEKTATKRNSHISKTRNSQRFNYGVFLSKWVSAKGVSAKGVSAKGTTREFVLSKGVSAGGYR